MTDIVEKHIRSRMMSSIRSKNTKPEMVVRKMLHHLGFRYRLHDKNLPGTPDLVFPKYHAVLFVNGCFWHGHRCSIFKWPASNQEFWKNKIMRNAYNDKKHKSELLDEGWRVGVIWECTLRKRNIPLSHIADEIVYWLKSGITEMEISS